VFEGDRSSIARQIGNGVPIPLAKAVAQSICSLFATSNNLIRHNQESPMERAKAA
jgi:DNA (cytosine-5)-methyltransferase 1